MTHRGRLERLLARAGRCRSALVTSGDGQPLEVVGEGVDPTTLIDAYGPLLREAAAAGAELGWGGVRSLGVRTERAVTAWAATPEILVGVVGPAGESLARARWATALALRDEG